MNVKNAVYGAIIGDVAGSRFEFNPIKSKNFDLFYSFSGKGYDVNQTLEDYFKSSKFTDDTVMTIAVANALIEANGDFSNLRELAVKNLKYFGRKYPYRGYGSKFQQWLNWDLNKPYNSFGNGSAMRISSVPYLANSIDEVKRLSKMVTDVTHNHPEGIKGAEAVAVSIWLALHNYTKGDIRKEVENNYYNLDYDYNELLKTYTHDETCQNSVPQSIYAFLISTDYEDCIRTAISMGGDADTMACIAGSIAGAYYGVPSDLQNQVLNFLPDEFVDIISNINSINKWL